jgi:DNA-binding NarL/FixJ family response regulator
LRILIADDSERVRSAITALISREARWEVCGEAANGEQALRKARELRPSVILLDINMPDVSGLEVARRLRREMPAVVIFVMSQDDANMLLPGAVAAGANGCLDKSNMASDLVRRLRAVGGNEHSGIQGAA